ncbi:ATP-NAD kinase family protein [Ferrimonas sp. YFM]|uniref:ATP-NAD kinase family protein n=1 Tax=Ferrimonas sp. YFM TaxID=3028878 RepID=UPI0025747C00|nr:ATP-NAD kinase family protein [Ferrimonas sp. YFM]BDY06118.1 ATP-NAD kinase [Ferrimonas sp. YFM]
MNRKFRLGVIINPLAGLGGSVALKGSDGMAEQALALGAEPKAHLRMATALEQIESLRDKVEILTASGAMGQALLESLGYHPDVVHRCSETSKDADTKLTAQALMDRGVDLILFAGGDGTARDICAQVHDRQPVLGVPAGVKIHSGVYGITPKASGEVVAKMIRGELLSTVLAEVRDIDEAAFRLGKVRARHYGEMRIPQALHYVQAVKMGGVEVEALVLDDISAEFQERLDDQWQYIMGSGSTVAAVMEQLGLKNTLLGVDLINEDQVLGQDMTADQLLRQVQGRPTKLVVTLIGGQGHLFGRGNQQLSPQLIRAVGRENILVLATKAKLEALEGRPMIADTGDPELDAQLAGWYPVITGYHDEVLYPLA